MRLLGLACCLILPGCVESSGSSCTIVPVVDVPLRMERTLPTVSVVIGGHSARFLLDTGSNQVVITEAVFTRLGLRYDEQASGYAMSFGGKAPLRRTQTVSIAIGGHALKLLALSVVSKATMLDGEHDGGFGIGGLLGMDALAGFDVDIDIPHRRLGLYEARHCHGGEPPFAGPSDTFTMPANGFGYASVPAVVDGRRLDLIVDTGASASIFDQDAVGLSDTALAGDRRADSETAGEARPKVPVHEFRSVQIGHADFTDATVPVFRFPFAAGGLVGSEFWAARRVWISAASGTITIQRAAP